MRNNSINNTDIEITAHLEPNESRIIIEFSVLQKRKRRMRVGYQKVRYLPDSWKYITYDASWLMFHYSRHLFDCNSQHYVLLKGNWYRGSVDTGVLHGSFMLISRYNTFLRNFKVKIFKEKRFFELILLQYTST